MRALGLVAIVLHLLACTPPAKPSPEPTPGPPAKPSPEPTPSTNEEPQLTPAPPTLPKVDRDGQGESAGEDDSFAFLAGEAIGGLRLDMPAAEIAALLGKPTQMGAIEQEEATGDFVQAWDYPDAGVHLYMRAGTRRGAQTLGSVSIEAPSKLETQRGIVIGSSRADVEKAYGDVRDREGADDDGSFVAGSIYGGLIFGFEGDVVGSIFMGAGAE